MISTRLKVVGIAIAAVVALTMFMTVSQASTRSAGVVSIDPVQVRAPINDVTGQAPPDPGAAAAAAYVRPTAPADQVAQAASAFAANPLVKRFLASHGIQIVDSAPWTDGTGTTVLGVDLTVRLSSPLTAAVALPAVSFHADEHAYDRVVQQVSFTNASEFDVLVDTSTRQVVRIAPTNGSETAIPGAASPSSPAAVSDHIGE